MWRVVDGPEEWVGTTIDWDLRQDGDYTIVLFKHQGWKEPVEFMHHCSTKWGSFLMSLKSLVETGDGRAGSAGRADQRLALIPAPATPSRPVGYVPLRVRTRPVTVMSMDAVLQALADGSRRTVLEILREHPATAGELAEALPIARPGVSRHLRVLREAGLVDVRQDAQRRIYSLRPEALIDVDEWLGEYRALWQNRLDALHTEIARGKKAQR